MIIFFSDNELDFLPFRFWIGMWTAFILLIIVAFDLSALVRHITRFTEESFACLIALIFIFEAFKKLFGILEFAPINKHPDLPLNYECECYPPNTTLNDTLLSFMHNMHNTSTSLYNQTMEAVTYFSGNETNFNDTNMTMFVNWTAMDNEVCKKDGGSLIGEGCDTPHYKADVFFLSIILFVGTFVIATGLTSFKTSRYFPSFVSDNLVNVYTYCSNLVHSVHFI